MRALRFAAALLIAPLALAPFTGARAQVGVGMGVAITVAPPMLPDYAQPPMPEVGYMWTPGYWAYGDGDYYWVQGTWVLRPNLLLRIDAGVGADPGERADLRAVSAGFSAAF